MLYYYNICLVWNNICCKYCKIQCYYTFFAGWSNGERFHHSYSQEKIGAVIIPYLGPQENKTDFIAANTERFRPGYPKENMCRFYNSNSQEHRKIHMYHPHSYPDELLHSSSEEKIKKIHNSFIQGYIYSRNQRPYR